MGRLFKSAFVLRLSTQSTSLDRHAPEFAIQEDVFVSKFMEWRTSDARVLSMGICQTRDDSFVYAITNGIDEVPYLRHFLVV